MVLIPWSEILESFIAQSNGAFTLVPGRGKIGDISNMRNFLGFLQEIRHRLLAHIRADKPRSLLNDYPDDLVARFLRNDIPVSWMHKQIETGLQRSYDQLI